MLRWGKFSFFYLFKTFAKKMQISVFSSYHFDGTKSYLDPSIYIYPTSDNVPRSYLEEKEMECMAKDETIRVGNSHTSCSLSPSLPSNIPSNGLIAAVLIMCINRWNLLELVRSFWYTVLWVCCWIKMKLFLAAHLMGYSDQYMIYFLEGGCIFLCLLLLL